MEITWNVVSVLLLITAILGTVMGGFLSIHKEEGNDNPLTTLTDIIQNRSLIQTEPTVDNVTKTVCSKVPECKCPVENCEEYDKIFTNCQNRYDEYLEKVEDRPAATSVRINGWKKYNGQSLSPLSGQGDLYTDETIRGFDNCTKKCAEDKMCTGFTHNAPEIGDIDWYDRCSFYSQNNKDSSLPYEISRNPQATTMLKHVEYDQYDKKNLNPHSGGGDLYTQEDIRGLDKCIDRCNQDHNCTGFIHVQPEHSDSNWKDRCGFYSKNNKYGNLPLLVGDDPNVNTFIKKSEKYAGDPLNKIVSWTEQSHKGLWASGNPDLYTDETVTGFNNCLHKCAADEKCQGFVHGWENIRMSGPQWYNKCAFWSKNHNNPDAPLQTSRWNSGKSRIKQTYDPNLYLPEKVEELEAANDVDKLAEIQEPTEI